MAGLYPGPGPSTAAGDFTAADTAAHTLASKTTFSPVFSAAYQTIVVLADPSNGGTALVGGPSPTFPLAPGASVPVGGDPTQVYAALGSANDVLHLIAVY
jgi:hypothetical protein